MPPFLPPKDTLNLDALFSPYATSLGTNFSAEGRDDRVVRGIVKAAEEELSQLNEMILWATSRQQSLTKACNDHKALLSPIRRLPDDILRELMIHCVASHWTGGTYSLAWTLSQVCRRWRQFARSTPAIWSYISVDFLECRHCHSDHHSERGTMGDIVEEMLCLSGGAALSVELIGEGVGMTSWDLWRIIFEHSRRIAFFSIAGDCLPSDFPRPFPILHSLRLYNSNSVDQVFQSSHKLTHVCLSNVGNTWGEFQELDLPWAQLKSAALQNAEGDLGQVLSLLKEMISVEELIVSVGKEVEMPPALTHKPIQDIFVLPKLRKLSLRIYDSVCATYLVQSLLLPALEELVLDASFAEERPGAEYKRFYERIALLIKSSRCSVTTFSLVDNGLTRQLQTILRTMPDLESFRHLASRSQKTTVFTTTLGSLLTFFIPDGGLKSSTRPLFPRLKNLEFSGTSLKEEEYIVVELLRSRKIGLRTLRLHVPDKSAVTNCSHLAEIAEIGAQGMVIDIRTDKDIKFSTLRFLRAQRQGILEAKESFLWTKCEGWY